MHALVSFVLNEYAALISSSCLTAPTSMAKVVYGRIRYDTIEEFNVDSKAEYTA